MNTFTVLDPHVELKKSLFLEASAGTGKTFSIENLYARLLLENRDLSIDNILVMTFTKAAVQDLKNRVKKNLETILACLHDKNKVPSFLEEICQNPKQELQAKLQLEEAIYHFDRSSIFTIHGFCYRALQENCFEASICQLTEDDTINKSDLLDVIQSYLATELNTKFISLAQLDILLKHFKNNVEKLQESLLSTILNGSEIISDLKYEHIFHKFCQVVNKYKWEKEKVLDDLCNLAPHYYELCDRSGKLKQENLEKFQIFAALFEKEEITAEDFDKQLESGLYAYQAFRKKKPKALSPLLHYPELLQTLEKEFWPIICEASHPLAIFAAVASGCQSRVHEHLFKKNKLEFSFLLKKMYQAVNESAHLRDRIRKKTRVVIVDEFQDTDPFQWKIFKTLFFQKECETIVYLVGDPKQSIYSFRSADIYTYLAAEAAIGNGNKATLQVNYRSQPSLIKALNDLFSEENTPGWIDLPLHGKHLPYSKVFPSDKNQDKTFKDTLGSIHFCKISASENESIEELETKGFFPFFAKEIKRLHVLEWISYQNIAILVHDRYQAKRLMKAFKEKKIPCILQKTGSIAHSAILPSLYELLKGIWHPKQESALKTALSGTIIGLDHEKISQLQDQAIYAQCVETAIFLKETWLQKGIGIFYQELLDSRWCHEKATIREKLLSYEDGASLYDELSHAMGLLLEFEFHHFGGPEKSIDYLKELILIKDRDDEDLKIQQDVTTNAVNILTIHASKGLEYDVVFALGLCNRSPIKESLIQNRFSQNLELQYFPMESKEYTLHVRECDAEKMRQLYVAMTRAKHRLYVPCIKGWKPPKWGSASSIELFLSRHHQAQADLETLYTRLQGDVTENIKATNEITIAEMQKEELIHDEMQQTLVLIPPEKITIPGKALFCSSFSSIATHGEILTLNENMPKNFEADEKTIHTLPAGRETGIVLHELLQKVPFSLDENELYPFVHGFVKGSYFENWVPVLAKVLFQVSHYPIGQEKILLKDLKEDRCFREMEFLLPSDEGSFPPGFVNGVADLIFSYNNKYYLIDWKTNWLGDSYASYSFEKMDQAMKAFQYPLQASIYTKALKSYVKLFDIRPFEQCFGGAIYIFLRGLNENNSTGVYHFFPKGDQ